MRGWGSGRASESSVRWGSPGGPWRVVFDERQRTNPSFNAVGVLGCSQAVLTYPQTPYGNLLDLSQKMVRVRRSISRPSRFEDAPNLVCRLKHQSVDFCDKQRVHRAPKSREKATEARVTHGWPPHSATIRQLSHGHDEMPLILL